MRRSARLPNACLRAQRHVSPTQSPVCAHAGAQATAALVSARESFLATYNGVAKHAVQALLAHLGRKGEHKLFFKDLQVNEGGRAKAKQAAPAPAAPSP